MQTIDGIVVNGAIVLQSSQKLPEGARVRVELIRSVPAPKSTALAILEEAVEHRKMFGGRSKEEIDADLAAMRAEDEVRSLEIEKLHECARTHHLHAKPE